MRKDDILNMATWQNSHELRLKCFPPVLKKSVDVYIFTQDEDRISDRSVQIVNNLLGLSVQHLKTIKEYLWEDCKLNCELTNYGFDVPEGKTVQEVNHEEFGVLNAEDAYEKSNLEYLLIPEVMIEVTDRNGGFSHGST